MARAPGCDGCDFNLGRLSDLAQILQYGMERQDWHAVREAICQLRTFFQEPNGREVLDPRGPATWVFPHSVRETSHLGRGE
jgi:hypothetical protein